MTHAIGYCTNVHAGASLADLRDSLQRVAVSVREHLGGESPLRVGLWISASTAAQLSRADECHRFVDFLSGLQLLPYTLNGFPYGDFHQRVVKHAVYSPHWLTRERMEYTLALIELLHQMLPSTGYGSISTLPLAWGTPQLAESQYRGMAEALAGIVRRLHELEQVSGRRICLCLEPEPGCALQRSADVVDFFERHLDQVEQPDRVRRYVGVCHDICHASVMFESQAQVLARYRQAAIHVGKVQVSSCLRVLFPGDESSRRREQRIGSLRSFVEDRYLHQTCVRLPDQSLRQYEDLPVALDAAHHGDWLKGSEWRVHFHVPIHIPRVGLLDTGQPDVVRCLAQRRPSAETHFEVETYAWNVLPAELPQADLATGIAQELRWLHEALDRNPAR